LAEFESENSRIVTVEANCLIWHRVVQKLQHRGLKIPRIIISNGIFLCEDMVLLPFCGRRQENLTKRFGCWRHGTHLHAAMNSAELDKGGHVEVEKLSDCPSVMQ
jgi:hypothetical protein